MSEHNLSESAAVLESEVKRRTEALESALRENQRIAQALEYRESILHAVTRSAAALLSNAPLADSIASLLRTVGEAIGADRILVLQHDAVAPRVVLRHGWHRRPEIVQATQELIAATARLEAPELAAWGRQLRAGGIVETRAQSATGATRDLFTALGIRSNLQIPIFANGAFWGHIAIDDCGSERDWVAAEIASMRVLADFIGASIERARSIEKLSNADTVVRNSPAILYRLRADTFPPAMVYVSDNVALLGRTAADFLADPAFYLSLVHPHDRAAAEQALADLRGGGGAGRNEFRVAAADGTWRWLENRYTPIRRAGAPLEIEGVLVDITDRRRAEDALRETLERRQRQFEVVGAVAQNGALVSGDVVSVAREITELAAKAAGCERVNVWLFNEDESELRCIDLYEATPGRHSDGMILRESEFRPEFRTLKTSKYVNADDAATDPRTSGYVEGYIKPLGITSMLDVVVGASGKSYGLLCFEHVGKAHHWEADEIAFAGQLADKIAFAIGARERRLAEEKVRGNEAALAAAQGIAHVGSWEYELTADVLTWSAETYRIFGADPAAFRPSYATFFARTHPGDRAAVEAAYRQSIEHRRPFAIEHRIVLDDGSIRWVHERGEPFYDSDGRPARSVGTVQDITERKVAELALSESQQIITAVFNSVSVRLFWKDRNLVYLGCNAAFARDAGFDDPKDIVGKDDYQMGWRDQADVYRADDREVIETGRSKLLIEEPQTTADGRTIALLTNKVPLRRPNGEIYGVLGTYMDITERKNAQEKLRRERDFSAALIDGLPGIFFVLDSQGRIVRNNASVSAVTGRSADELRGTPALDYVAPADRDLIARRIVDVLERGQAEAELGVVHADGSVRRFSVTSRRIALDDGPGILGMGIDVTEARKAERLLRESEARFKGLVENSVDWVWAMDPEFRYTYASPRCIDLFGYTPEELVGRSAFDFMRPEDAERTKAETADLFAERRPMLNFETTFVHKSGRIIFTETNATPYFDADGNYRGYHGIDRDVTERNRITRALRESEEKFRTIFGGVTEGIFLVDPAAGTFVDVNKSACQMFGYAREELVGRPIAFVSSGEPAYGQVQGMLKIDAVRSVGPQSFEWHCRDKNGRLFWVDASVRVTSFGGETLALATVRDITEQKRSAAQILQMARYDALTGLANRRVFAEAVQQAIARTQRGAKAFAVLYLDLDHFKDINDTLGHPVGDLLLKSVAARLKATVRETDTVARFGGDEFAVLAADINDPTDAGVLGEKILAAVSKPVTIQGNEIRSGTSVGISVYGPESPEAETLLAHADVALYRAKSEGRGTYRFFTDSMDADVRRRVKLDADLRAALESEQMFLVYQPQVEAATGRIVGVEALVRWRHPDRGIVAPDEFISAAEKNGLIVPLGRWVLRTACRQAKAWREAGAVPMTVGVNISALQFKTPLELERDIDAALAESGLPPQLLELELTESVLMKASHEHNDVLLRLRKKGLRLAIDDFGTGFSSLDYLRRFPVDRIKIAQVFIIDLVTAAGDAAIVKAAIGLARELGISVIAEGVETEAQLRLLQAWGCREVQGYYFSKPAEAARLLPALCAGRIAGAGPALTKAAL